MRQIRAFIRSIPRQTWRSSGNPPYLHICRDGMNIAIRPASGGSGINTCDTVLVTLQLKNGKYGHFFCNRAELL